MIEDLTHDITITAILARYHENDFEGESWNDLIVVKQILEIYVSRKEDRGETDQRYYECLVCLEGYEGLKLKGNDTSIEKQTNARAIFIILANYHENDFEAEPPKQLALIRQILETYVKKKKETGETDKTYSDCLECLEKSVALRLNASSALIEAINELYGAIDTSSQVVSQMEIDKMLSNLSASKGKQVTRESRQTILGGKYFQALLQKEHGLTQNLKRITKLRDARQILGNKFRALKERTNVISEDEYSYIDPILAEIDAHLANEELTDAEEKITQLKELRMKYEDKSKIILGIEIIRAKETQRDIDQFEKSTTGVIKRYGVDAIEWVNQTLKDKEYLNKSTDSKAVKILLSIILRENLQLLDRKSELHKKTLYCSDQLNPPTWGQRWKRWRKNIYT